MKIYFRAECKARITEHWSIKAPPGWHDMSKMQRLAWLQQNIEAADYLSQEKIHNMEIPVVLDFHGS